MSTPQQESLQISEFCARVYRQNEQRCGSPPATKLGAARRNYFGEPDPATNFNDEAAETAWSYRWGTQTPISHVNLIPPDDDVYEGFDEKARPMDSVPAYIVEHALISFEDAVEYIYRAGHGCHWGGKKLVSGEAWPDITAIARIVSAYFQVDAMRELVAWFVKEYPHETTEMGLPDSDVEQDLRDGAKTEAGDDTPIRRPSDNAITAWRLRLLIGQNQTQIAQRMSQELGKSVDQGTVSRWLTQVDKYVAAGNVLPDLPAPISKPQAIDPSKIDMGERTDGRPPRQRQKRTPNSD